MRTRTIAVFLLVTIGIGYSPAVKSQEDDGQWVKATNTCRHAEFPKVRPDGRVWFQFKAPLTAQSVQVHINNTDYDMEKDADGLWNVIIAQPEPGYQVYWMVVDGVMVQDPGSTPFYQNG